MRKESCLLGILLILPCLESTNAFNRMRPARDEDDECTKTFNTTTGSFSDTDFAQSNCSEHRVVIDAGVPISINCTNLTLAMDNASYCLGFGGDKKKGKGSGKKEKGKKNNKESKRSNLPENNGDMGTEPDSQGDDMDTGVMGDITNGQRMNPHRGSSSGKEKKKKKEKKEKKKKEKKEKKGKGKMKRFCGDANTTEVNWSSNSNANVMVSLTKGKGGKGGKGEKGDKGGKGEKGKEGKRGREIRKFLNKGKGSKEGKGDKEGKGGKGEKGGGGKVVIPGDIKYSCSWGPQ